MKDESTVQQEIQIEARYYDCHLMRNNQGSFKDDTGRVVRFGLGNISKQHNDKIKSSDLVGFTKVVITQEMVGKTLAVFTAVECKKEDWDIQKKFDARETAQEVFIKWINNNGGIAFFANHVDDLNNLIRQ